MFSVAVSSLGGRWRFVFSVATGGGYYREYYFSEVPCVAGFGKFGVGERAARAGLKPATGETIQIAASRVAKFSAVAALKKQLNG